MKKLVVKFIFGFFICCAAPSVYGWTADGENPWVLQPKNVPETEHRKFANPLSGKKPHLLFVAMAQRLRDIQELAQRVECTYELWPWYKYDIFSPFGKEKLYAGVLNQADHKKELDTMFSTEKLAKFDGIVFGKADILLMPPALRNRILDQVRKGTPLFLFMMDTLLVPEIKGADFKEYSVDFLNQINPYVKDTVIRKAVFGKGAVYAICFPKQPAYTSLKQLKRERYTSLDTLAPYNADHPLWYDYTMAFTGKLFLNVFNPDRVKIEKLHPDGTFTLSDKVPANYHLRYEIVNRYNRNIASGKTVVSAKKIAIPANLPLSASIMNVFLCDEKGHVADYAATALKPDVPVSISSVTTNKVAYDADEPVQITVVLTGKVTGKLTLSLKDDRGRIIARKEIPAVKKGTTELRFPYSGSHYAEVSAILQSGKRIYDEVHAEIYFKDTADYLKDIRFLMWSGMSSKSRVHNQLMKIYKEAGVDALYDFGIQWAYRYAEDSLRNACRTGFWYSAAVASLINRYRHQKLCNFSAWDLYQKTGKFYDSMGNILNSQLQTIARILPQLRDKYGVLFYSLGDETVVGYGQDTCYCAECLVRFRVYLKRIYGNIKKLNQEYGSKYKSFAEVTGLPLEQAADADLIPMWIDYRLFMEEEFINWYRVAMAMIRQYDPKAVIGSEGYVYPAKSVSGFNFYKLLPITGFGAFYLNERDHVAAQYFPKNSIVGTILGTYEGLMNPGRMKYDVWYTFFEGFQSILWWHNYNITTGYSNSADFGFMLQKLSQFNLPMQEFSAIRKSGLGKLLISSTKRDDGIRIHYSNNCLHAATVAPDKNTWDGSLSDFSSMLYSLGFTYKYINPQEVEAGIPKNVKILILPYSQAMSDLEITRIKEFVKRGGLLITDYNPAVFDEHGKVRTESPLLPVFGKFSRLNINKYGQGYAVYLDNYLTGANTRINSNSAAGIQQGMLRLLDLVHVRPFADITDSHGVHQKSVTFEKEKEKYICMLGPIMEKGAERTSATGAEGGIAKVAVGGTLDRTVKLSETMHVYDMAKNGKYLGLKDTIQVKLEPSRGYVLFCSPVKIEKPAIHLSSKKVSRGDKLILHLSDFVNTAILKIYDPQGNCVREKRVSPGQERFVPAWNEPTGKYTAELINIAGRNKTSVPFTVK